MFDYVRITLAVPHTFVASVKKNTAEILQKIKEADAAGAEYVAFPELALTGATCGDLFFQKTLWENVKAAFEEIALATEKRDLTVLVGAPVRILGVLYNAAAVFSGGRLCGIVPKTYLANHGDACEKRYFHSGSEFAPTTVDSTCFGLSASYPVPVASHIVFTGRGGETFGVELGTDLYSPVSPGNITALAGAELLFNLAAMTETVTKRDYRKNFVTMRSSSLVCAYAYVSAGSGESVTDGVYAGHSVVAENGVTLYENTKFIDDDYLMNADIDLGKLRADRAKNSIFSDSAVLYGASGKAVYTKVYAPLTHRTTRDDEGLLYPLCKTPFVPENSEKRTVRCFDIYQMQVTALASRLAVAAQKVVVGVSGGLDSTLALLVCVGAMKKLGRPVKNVIGITMPCFGTTSRTYNNSLALMQSLGITTREISIKEACLLHFKDIGHDEAVKDITFENVQARERTQVLMDVANQENALVCGTGDLSELALGWCTYNADHMSMYGINAGVPKTLIRSVIEILAASDIFKDSAQTLRDIADTPISPELLPPDETGKIAQKTEDSVGPYILHDFFLYYALRFGFTPDKIEMLANRAFAGDFDKETIRKWLKNFYRRFFTQQFKRSCQPDGVKIGSVGLSPRSDLHMPSDASFADFDIL